MTTNKKDHQSKVTQNQYYNFPNSFKKEGVDHINISPMSETKLGKILDPSYVKVINYPGIGKFNSVINMWYWLRSTNLDDSIRRFDKRSLDNYKKVNFDIFKVYVPNFKAIIGYGTWLKIKNNAPVLEEIKNLDDNIKFISYKVVKSTNIKISTSYAVIMNAVANAIVKAVKEGRDPDFTSLSDKPDVGRFFFLEGFLSRVIPAEEIEKLITKPVTNTEDEDLDEVLISSLQESNAVVNEEVTKVPEETKPTAE